MTDDKFAEMAKKIIQDIDCDLCQSSREIWARMTTIVSEALRAVDKEAYEKGLAKQFEIQQIREKQAEQRGLEKAARRVESLISPDCHTTRCNYVNVPCGICTCNLPRVADEIRRMK